MIDGSDGLLWHFYRWLRRAFFAISIGWMVLWLHVGEEKIPFSHWVAAFALPVALYCVLWLIRRLSRDLSDELDL